MACRSSGLQTVEISSNRVDYEFTLNLWIIVGFFILKGYEYN